MQCLECGNMQTRILDTKSYAGAVYRQRICWDCKTRFRTEEIEIEEDSSIVQDMLKFYRKAQKRK